jgi:Flp pilus assembly protein TadG
MMLPRPRERPEDGATTIVVALVALLLFASAAIAVDLGNAWARERQVQTQVDVAALSAGDLLPATTPVEERAIAGRIATYLTEPANEVPGQQPVTAGQLLDLDPTNGEVSFTTDGAQLTLLAPRAEVDFIFAGVASDASSVRVTASASVGVFSQVPRENVLPFWLPSGCPPGPADGDTTGGGGSGGGGGNGGGGGGNGSATGTPVTGVNLDPREFNSTAQPDTANRFENNKTISFRVTGVSKLKSNKAPVVQFEKRDNPTLRYAFTGTWTKVSGDQDWAFTIVVGASDVTAHAGQWSYQTVAPPRTGNNEVYSQVENFNVQPGAGTPPPSAASCASGPSRGNFGQLDSPRKESGSTKDTLALNIALGLDHTLGVVPNAVSDECAGPPRATEQLDDVSRDGNNCLLAEPGNAGPGISQGLLGTPDGSLRGRLDTRNGPTRTDCGRSDDSIGGAIVNNDVLSCFLAPGASLADLTVPMTDATTGTLDPAVVTSPRFVWIPQVYRSNRSSKSFQPVQRFVPAFITDEDATARKGASTATVDNGVVCNGNRTQCNSVSAMKVFTFDPSWLPLDDASPLVAYDPVVGRKAWTLVG